jgi:hypothetical protein
MSVSVFPPISGGGGAGGTDFGGETLGSFSAGIAGSKFAIDLVPGTYSLSISSRPNNTIEVYTGANENYPDYSFVTTASNGDATILHTVAETANTLYIIGEATVSVRSYLPANAGTTISNALTTLGLGSGGATIQDIAFGNGVYLIATQTNVLRTTDLVNFTPVSPNASFYYRGVSFGNGVFVLAGINAGIGLDPSEGTSTSGAIWTSTDGITWTQRLSVSDTPPVRINHQGGNNWTAAAWFSGLSAGSRYYYSTDNGVSWLRADMGGSIRQFNRNIAFNGTNLYVGVGNSHIFTGSTLNNITNQSTSLSPAGANGIAFGNGVFVKGGEVGDQVETSTNGTTWTNRAVSLSGAVQRVYYNAAFGGFIIISNSGRVAVSADGVSWTVRPTFGAGVLTSLAMTGTTAVVIGGSGFIGRSTDSGANFTALTSPLSAGAGINTFAASTTMVLAAGANGALSTTTDGTTWTSRNANQGTTAITASVFGGNRWVIGTASGGISTSTDGINWTAVSGLSGIFGGTQINTIVFGNGKYVAGTATGIIAESADATTWVVRTSALTSVRAGVFDKGEFYLAGAVGSIATVVYSGNGSTWTAGGASGSHASFTSITKGPNGSLFVAGALNNSSTWPYYRSTDGFRSSPTSIMNPTTQTATTNPIMVYGNGVLLLFSPILSSQTFSVVNSFMRLRTPAQYALIGVSGGSSAGSTHLPHSAGQVPTAGIFALGRFFIGSANGNLMQAKGMELL